jgi:hypothetical protein
VFLFLLSPLFLFSALPSFAFPEDFVPPFSGSAPGPPVGAMFELSILSLLTLVSVSSLPALTLVFELPPPHALPIAAMVNKARIVKVRRIEFPSPDLQGFVISDSIPQTVNSALLYSSSSSGATPK